MRKPKFEDTNYIIAYDIQSNKTRSKVAQILIETGLKRVNKSVYEGKIPKNQFSKIFTYIYNRLESNDCIVIYPVTYHAIMKKQVLVKRNSVQNEDGPIIF